MNLLIPLDFSGQQQPGAFTAAQGDVISITHEAWLPGDHLPPALKAGVIDGPGVVEVLGTFGHGVINRRVQADGPAAVPTIPSPSTVLIRAAEPGTATLEVATVDSPAARATRSPSR